MEKYYQFAGMDFLIDIPDEQMYCDDRRLAAFRVEKVTEPHCFQFQIVEELEAPGGAEITVQPGFRVYQEGDWSVRYIGGVQQTWEPAYIRAAHKGKQHNVQLKAAQFTGRVGTQTVLNSMAAEKLIVQEKGVILHASFIAYKDRAILFTAPSGTGKSTQADLWKDLRGAEIINGDRVAIRLVEGTILAEGIPFAGSSQYCENRSLPLAAVVYLGQAPTTTIRRVKGAEAFMRIWEGCSINTWDKDDVGKVTDLVAGLVQSVPIYHLVCTPDESAITALEQELRK